MSIQITRSTQATLLPITMPSSSMDANRRVKSWSSFCLVSSFVLCLAMMMLVALPAVSRADTADAGWQVSTQFIPSILPPGGKGEIVIYPYNVGAASSASETIVDTLPAGVTAIPSQATNNNNEGASVISCSGTKIVTCEIGNGNIGPGELVGENAPLHIPVKIAGGSEGVGVNRVTVSGGGTVSATTRSMPVRIGSEAPGFGFSGFEAWFSNADGTVDTQAGSHPYEFTTAFSFNATSERLPAGGEVRNLHVNLPPGVIGDTRAVPQCTFKQFEEGTVGIADCPASTMVGEDLITIGENSGAVTDEQAVYNMVPPAGVAAQFAFRIDGIITLLDIGVRTGGDDGITVHVNNIAQREIIYNSTIIWGVPAEESHDARRVSNQNCNPKTGCAAGVPDVPLITLPTACSGPLQFGIEAFGTYQEENAFAKDTSTLLDDVGNPVGMSGCDLLGRFNPQIDVTPDTSDSDTPAGLTAEVSVPEEDLGGLTTVGQQSSADIKNTTVVLPKGVVINPGQATGLVACPAADEALGTEGPGTEDPATCPASSKVGEDEIETPLLSNRLKGNVYILEKDPPNLELLVTASGEGVNVKLVGDVHLDPVTGQLTTTFKETPELPFTHFRLAFSSGAQAALATPTSCGTFGTSADFTPWNTPFAPDFLEESLFQIAAGPAGGACADPMPFTPSLIAGSTTDQAGGYTDFSVLLQRGDGQQRISGLQFKVPEGLLGMISKVPLCQEPQAAQGTCSAASEIGHTVVAAGPGPYPLFIPPAGEPPSPIYLTGPYDGAPYGLSIVVPIHAGPFTLQTQVVRARIEVDPHTARLTVTTDPLPTIVDGIPADLREIDAVIDRPEFMFNPTSCAPMSFSGTATSTEGATAPLESHFQMGSCQALKFQPDFKVSTSAKTSRKNGASLTVKIIYPVGNLGDNQASSQSNINSVKVDLPKQLPSRLTTLQKACPAKTFEADPAACPADSIVGHAKAITPVLPVPIEGPAYFVSHAGEEFPNLILVLQGYGVTIDLVGDTYINPKTSITSSTFKQIPDVPIQSFELNLPQGPFSALAANTNLCKVKGGLKMPTAFTGQNGAEIHQTTAVAVTGCGKSKHKTVKHKIKKNNKHKHKQKKK
jgi:hypothetical protein